MPVIDAPAARAWRIAVDETSAVSASIKKINVPSYVGSGFLTAVALAEAVSRTYRSLPPAEMMLTLDRANARGRPLASRSVAFTS